MSYTSESKLPRAVKLAQLQEVVELLGYMKIRDDLKIPSMVGSYIWYEENDYKSWSGVELQIYRKSTGFTVDTRSTVSRSCWDLKHQNKTLKLIRDLFGGYFET